MSLGIKIMADRRIKNYNWKEKPADVMNDTQYALSS
jgi:hypothetical protein